MRLQKTLLTSTALLTLALSLQLSAFAEPVKTAKTNAAPIPKAAKKPSVTAKTNAATAKPTVKPVANKPENKTATKPKEKEPVKSANAKPGKNTASKTKSTEEPTALVLTEEQKAALTPQTVTELEKLSTALKFEANNISQDLQDDQELMIKDVAMLWQAAVERSSSIRFALEKLSRQDETGKPVQGPSMGRKLAQSAARMAGVAGSMVTANPAGMIGGGVIEQILLQDPTSSALQRVTDADMVILAKQVESLQSRVIELYYRYRQSKERYLLTQEASSTLTKYYDQYNQSNANPAFETILNSLYENAKQDEGQARQSYVTARNELGLMVGPDALRALESAHQSDSKASAD